MNPKVFISHASEDKERFVLGFTQKLREKGVDAWLDRWEMLPGDSLVEKIFEEGIKNANAVIVVLSSNSVSKKWVREELDAAMVKRVNKGSLLIPIVLDDCDIPECLHSTIWQKVTDLENYNDSFQRVINAIFEHREKPALGELPEFAKAPISLVPGHTKTDSIILKIVCEIALEKDSMHYVETQEVFDGASKFGISIEMATESLEVLDQDGLVKLIRVCGSGPPPDMEILSLGLEKFAETYISDYDAIKSQVIACIINNEMKSASEISIKLGKPIPLVEHIFRLLELNGFLTISDERGMRALIYNISPKLKRLLS